MQRRNEDAGRYIWKCWMILRTCHLHTSTHKHTNPQTNTHTRTYIHTHWDQHNLISLPFIKYMKCNKQRIVPHRWKIRFFRITTPTHNQNFLKNIHKSILAPKKAYMNACLPNTWAAISQLIFGPLTGQYWLYAS